MPVESMWWLCVVFAAAGEEFARVPLTTFGADEAFVKDNVIGSGKKLTSGSGRGGGEDDAGDDE